MFYSQIFNEHQYEGLDFLNDAHIHSLHHIYIPKINNPLQEFIQQMSNQRVTSEHNQSPLSKSLKLLYNETE